MNDPVGELSTANLAIAFKDHTNQECVPTSARYRIDDVQSGGEILDWTDMGSISTSVHNLKIPALCNRILDASSLSELRLVTIEFGYGVEDRGTLEYEYTVKNLRRYSTLDYNGSLVPMGALHTVTSDEPVLSIT